VCTPLLETFRLVPVFQAPAVELVLGLGYSAANAELSLSLPLPLGVKITAGVALSQRLSASRTVGLAPMIQNTGVEPELGLDAATAHAGATDIVGGR